MFRGTTFACAMALGLAFGASANAQVVMQPNVSLQLAREIADTTLAACNAAGFDTSVAVVDRAGHTMVLLRGTTSSPQTAEMARRKAYSARMWRRPTALWAQQTRDDPARYPQRDLADVLALSGGIPIKVGEETIGGVGSSGANLQQDNDCAQAGVDAVAAQLQ
jgi:uncharacterized protein GlcG (DUF336 family)